MWNEKHKVRVMSDLFAGMSLNLVWNEKHKVRVMSDLFAGMSLQWRKCIRS